VGPLPPGLTPRSKASQIDTIQAGPIH